LSEKVPLPRTEVSLHERGYNHGKKTSPNRLRTRPTARLSKNKIGEKGKKHEKVALQGRLGKKRKRRKVTLGAYSGEGGCHFTTTVD